MKPAKVVLAVLALAAIAVGGVVYLGPLVGATAARVTGPACRREAPANPWGYDFCEANGSKITVPPADLCAHVRCVDGFWPVPRDGWLEECPDHTFSASAGYLPGGCVDHGGAGRTLYQHPGRA
jgi:hypothetical protein